MHRPRGAGVKVGALVVLARNRDLPLHKVSQTVSGDKGIRHAIRVSARNLAKCGVSGLVDQFQQIHFGWVQAGNADPMHGKGGRTQ